MAEAISIVVFILFSRAYQGETPNWRAGLALILVSAAVLVAFGRYSENGAPGRGQLADGPVAAQGRQSSLKVGR
jgi:hypothetical protein